MAQEDVGDSRPVDLTDSQVEDLTTGKNLDVGEHSRPRALTDRDVEALGAGKDISLESLPAVERLGSAAERMVSERLESRPRALRDKDVEALSAGKDIDLGKIDRLEAQQL